MVPPDRMVYPPDASLRTTWNHPICKDCWEKRWAQEFHWSMVNMQFTDYRQCCDCGKGTLGGAIIHDDPTKVRFPAIIE